MAKKPHKMTITWAISRIKGTPAAVIGHVEAPDAESTIKEAIRQFNITDPAQQKRLAARPVQWPGDPRSGPPGAFTRGRS